MFDIDRLASLATSSVPDRGIESSRPRIQRRAAGAYFTPPALVAFVVDAVLFEVCRKRETLAGLRVLDPACGDGRFLEVAAAWLSARYGVSLLEASRHLIGIERDAEFAQLASARVPGAAIHCDDALRLVDEVGVVDAVVGNPPYLRSIDREPLRGRYAASSHGEWDLYAVFLEQSLAWARSSGEVGLVVPSRWLTAQSASRLRCKLASERAMRGVVDFGELQLFRDATTYVSVAFLSGSPRDKCHVARYRAGHWSHGQLDNDERDAGPWNLAVGREHAVVDCMKASSVTTLGKVAGISKGAGTSADRVFVFDHYDACGETISVCSRAARATVALESSLVRSCFRGRDVPELLATRPTSKVLVPYDDGGKLLSAETLAANYPLTWSYFQRCRSQLEVREGGRWRGRHFYCFGRPQNMAKLSVAAPRVVVPDVSRGGRAVVDHRATFVLDSAYAIFPDCQEHVAALAAVLASPVVAYWFACCGMLVRGGYIRMKTKFLERLPLPDMDALSQALTRRPDAWKELVARSYGFSRGEVSPPIWS